MNIEQNKACAIAFYKMAYLGNPQKAVDLYVGEEYIQHNPDVANDLKGFIDYFDRMQKEYPDKSIEFIRCIGEGELVALHTHQIWPGNDQYVTMDFFRFDDMVKFVNIGMLYNPSLKIRLTQTQCIDIVSLRTS